jgi:hypothetical protein
MSAIRDADVPLRRLPLSHAQFRQLALDLLPQGRPLPFVAHGTSMMPFIRPADRLTLVAAEPEQLKIGDVVLAEGQEGRLVAHRIVAERFIGAERWFVTRGDGCLQQDLPIPTSRIVGKVESVFRGGKPIDFGAWPWRMAIGTWDKTWPLGPWLQNALRHGRRATIDGVRRFLALLWS